MEDSYGKITKAEIIDTKLIIETEKCIYREINRKGRKALSLRPTLRGLCG
ncbi:hypothetical protein [Treponema sp. OMZ 787]|nr:hypothetical protein [Treponema sp. OMZ 787]